LLIVLNWGEIRLRPNATTTRTANMPTSSGVRVKRTALSRVADVRDRAGSVMQGPFRELNRSFSFFWGPFAWAARRFSMSESFNDVVATIRIYPPIRVKHFCDRM
jgi:hypothetical protein